MRDLSSLLPSAPLTGNSSMAATNTITDQSGSMTAPGSVSESTAREVPGDPAPALPPARPPTVVVSGDQGQGYAPWTDRGPGGWSQAGDDSGRVTGGWTVP